MSKSSTRSAARSKRTRRRTETEASVHRGSLELDEKYRPYFWAVVIGLFAVYMAVLYYGHQAVPNSDFPAFYQTGRSILSFELPSSFKRLPGLGVLQVLLSYLMPGRHPGLTAGWTLNAVLYVATGVLLVGVGKKVIGRASAWFALLVLINPAMVQWMRHPIAEMALVFFIVLTFFLLLRPTRWAYVPAMLTALVRYEGAILILLCFCVDIVLSRGWKNRVLAFVRAGLAALPLALWMLGMILSRPAGSAVGGLPYLRNYDVDREMVIGKFAGYVWNNGVGSLFVLSAQESLQALAVISKAALAIALVLAAVFCIIRKQWRVMLLLGFFGIFFVLHATRTYTLPRYGVPAIWVTILLAWYGLKSVWDYLVEKQLVPVPARVFLQVGILVIAGLWAVMLLRHLPEMAPLSRQSASVPFMAMLAVAVVLGGRFVLFERFSGSKAVSAATIAAVMGLMVVSNQFRLVRQVGNGTLDQEFQQLADWYYEHAEEGEILLTTMPHVVTLFLPDGMHDAILSMQRIPGETPNEFLQECFERGVRYLAWDSRIGLTPDNTYYRRWKMPRVDFLRTPRDYGPLNFVARIQNEDYPYRYINLYEIRTPSPPPGPTPGPSSN